MEKNKRFFLDMIGVILGISIFLIMIPEIQNIEPIVDIDSTYQYTHNSDNSIIHGNGLNNSDIYIQDFDYYSGGYKDEYNYLKNITFIGSEEIPYVIPTFDVSYGNKGYYYGYSNNLSYSLNRMQISTYNLYSANIYIVQYSAPTFDILTAVSVMYEINIVMDEITIDSTYDITQSDFSILDIYFENNTHFTCSYFEQNITSNITKKLEVNNIELDNQVNNTKYVGIIVELLTPLGQNANSAIIGFDSTYNLNFYNLSTIDFIEKDNVMVSDNTNYNFTSIHQINSLDITISYINITQYHYIEFYMDEFYYYNVTSITNSSIDTPFILSISSVSANISFYMNVTIEIDYIYHSDLEEIALETFIPLVIIGVIVVIILGFTKFDETRERIRKRG